MFVRNYGEAVGVSKPAYLVTTTEDGLSEAWVRVDRWYWLSYYRHLTTEEEAYQCWEEIQAYDVGD